MPLPSANGRVVELMNVRVNPGVGHPNASQT